MRFPPPLPRDKETLLRELDASIKIKDIQALERLRERVEIKWWESGLILILFVSALGFLSSVVLLLRRASPISGALMQRWVLVWFIPLVFAIILTLEVVLAKLNALRRLNQATAHVLEALRQEVVQLSSAERRGVSPPEHQDKPDR